MDAPVKIELEFTLNISIKRLYDSISTPSGLSDWFADDVNIKGKDYTFFWDGDERIASMLAKKKEAFIRFKWADDEDLESYFEFKIINDELTSDVSLVVTDFAPKDEIKEITDLWNKQVANLKHVLGA